MLSFELKHKVKAGDTAAAVGSGELPVLATPVLAALMEKAAMKCAAPLLQAGQTTVGSQVEVFHRRPTAVNCTVTVRATVAEHSGRKITFNLEAEDGSEVIARGTHTRYIVNSAEFMEKLAGGAKACKKVRVWLAAVAISLAMLAADYLVSNISFPLFDSSESLNWLGYLFPDRNRLSTDDALFVNVAMDRQLVAVTDEFGDTAGVADITDRQALLRFLRIASQADYRYIFLDVRFEHGLVSEQDPALFALMDSLPRFTFSTHRALDGYELAEPSLLHKGAMADYRSNMFTGFSRYEFLQEGCESVALRMYRELCGGEISRCGMLFFSDGRPAYNMLFIPLPAELNRRIAVSGQVMYPYLGSQILKMYSAQELAEMMRGKVIVIGDFDADLHQSYVGEVPGTMIHYYAFRALEAGAHRVNMLCMLAMFIIYTLLTANLLGGNSIADWLAWRLHVRTRFGLLIMSFLGWEAALSLLKIALYMAFGFSFIAIVPSVVFTAISFKRKLSDTKLISAR